MTGFSGSYAAEDVTFLLKRIDLAPTAIAEKERLIQSGRRHYSEMISAETAPDGEYLALYHAAVARTGARLARDLVALALALAGRPPGPLVLASIARAGTPIGVLLRRLLARLGRPAPHYSISLIRDRGIDSVALDHMRARHPGAGIVFVDGWTGKGAIMAELTASLDRYNRARGTALMPDLAVVADLAGVAGLAATSDDYLIPCSILNAVVSGLVSRTILNAQDVGAGEFHACVLHEALAPHDLSRAFVDAIEAAALACLERDPPPPARWEAGDRRQLRATAEGFVAQCLQRYGISDRNRVKPGIGEATRALLRRLPERLLLRERGAEDLAHLELLAATRGVPVELRADLPAPYRAATIIRTLGEG